MTKHFDDLTAIDCPFGELDVHTQNRLFQSFIAGADIECKMFPTGTWSSAGHPLFRSTKPYRVKPKPPTKPSINWSHVATEYRWLARDSNGRGWLYHEKPSIDCRADQWSFCEWQVTRVNGLASYTPGTCDWRDSLVQRPDT